MSSKNDRTVEWSNLIAVLNTCEINEAIRVAAHLLIGKINDCVQNL